MTWRFPKQSVVNSASQCTERGFWEAKGSKRKEIGHKGASWTTTTAKPNSVHEKWRVLGHRVPTRLCRDGWHAWTSPRSWRGTFWTSKRGYGSLKWTSRNSTSAPTNNIGAAKGL